MADWDEDSPRLRRNLAQVLRDIEAGARRRDVASLAMARQWHIDTMMGLAVPDPAYVGRFRGEPGPETTRVWVGDLEGVPPHDVARQLGEFEQRLQRTVAALDARYPDSDQALDRDGVAAVIDLCAWAHAEWVRIHPFANGNGRTARLWANALFLRYGLPPVVRLRPRPEGAYGAAGARAMQGDWRATAQCFRRLLLALPEVPASVTPP